MKNDANFWNNVAEKYSRSPVKDIASWDETLMRSRDYLKGAHSVLEIGAGTGSTALRMHDAAARYRATDISSEMIAIANDKLKASDAKNLEFAVASIFDEAPQSYDAVLAYNLLHLVDSVPETARAVHAALKDGGVFISKSGCISGKYAALKAPIWVMQRFGKAPHINAFSSQKLRDEVAGAGFEILEGASLPQGAMTYFLVARKI